jgi:LysR family hydrogen peroxide-inducible transcriptional activator
MPTLRQLRYLVALADTLSFRRAAEICRVSQPALSDQIQSLENRLQIQLVERNRRRVLLTPAGREVVERARKVLRDVQDIVELAGRGRHALEGTLRWGVLPSLGPYVLPLILPSLHRRYPGLMLYLREDSGEALARRLEDGDLDILLATLPAPSSPFAAEPLFHEPLWLAMARDHPLAAKSAIEAADLKGLRVLALEAAHSLHEELLALCRRYDAEPLLEFATTSLDTLRQMAGMGLGVTFLPALYVRAEARQDPQIAVRSFAASPSGRTIGLVWRTLSARGQQYRALAKDIRDTLEAEVPEVRVCVERPNEG